MPSARKSNAVNEGSPSPPRERGTGGEAREAPAGDPAVPRLELAEWADRYGLVAGITTRGSEASPYSLGLWSDEAVGAVMTRWRAFRAAWRPRFGAVLLSHQVHGTAVGWHDDVPDGWQVLDGLDGHATAAAGVLLTITVADCIPVYLSAPERGAIALLHAGWRGTAGGVLSSAVAVLRGRGIADPASIVMHCGVGICGECYEVGSEVAARFGAGSGDGPSRLDLRAALAAQAAALGIRDVSISPWCSAHDRDRFFSHRASSGRDGRMVAYLGRPSA